MSTTYSEKLRSPLWQRKRLSIFDRDGWKCTNCKNSERELQVHHVDYFPNKEPWEYPDDMLLTLCHVCHAKENGRGKGEKYLLNTLKMKGFLLSDLMALSCYFDTQEKYTESLLKVLREGRF